MNNSAYHTIAIVIQFDCLLYYGKSIGAFIEKELNCFAVYSHTKRLEEIYIIAEIFIIIFCYIDWDDLVNGVITKEVE